MLAAAAGLAVVATLAIVAWTRLADVPPPLIAAVAWRPPALSGKPLVVVVDLEDEGAWVRPWRALGRAVVEEADVDVHVMPVASFTPQAVAGLAPRAVLVSGFLARSPRESPGLAALEELVRTTTLPVLGTCGGHQLIGRAFGAQVVARGNEERGLVEVTRSAGTSTDPAEPLLGGVPRSFIAYSWHRMELRAVPPDFVLLAGTEACPVQAMRHAARPVHGVQFHPELTPRGEGGRRVLRNFLALAGLPLREGNAAPP